MARRRVWWPEGGSTGSCGGMGCRRSAFCGPLGRLWQLVGVGVDRLWVEGAIRPVVQRLRRGMRVSSNVKIA